MIRTCCGVIELRMSSFARFWWTVLRICAFHTSILSMALLISCGSSSFSSWYLKKSPQSQLTYSCCFSAGIKKSWYYRHCAFKTHLNWTFVHDSVISFSARTFLSSSQLVQDSVCSRRQTSFRPLSESDNANTRQWSARLLSVDKWILNSVFR